MMVHVNTVVQTFLNYTNAANADRVGLLVLMTYHAVQFHFLAGT